MPYHAHYSSCYSPNLMRSPADALACCSADVPPGLIGNFADEMTAYLNTFTAIPAPNMIMSFGGQMRSEAAEAMWKLIYKIPITVAETAAMFYTDYTPTPGADVYHSRYFSATNTPTTRAAGGTTSVPPCRVGAVRTSTRVP